MERKFRNAELLCVYKNAGIDETLGHKGKVYYVILRKDDHNTRSVDRTAVYPLILRDFGLSHAVTGTFWLLPRECILSDNPKLTCHNVNYYSREPVHTRGGAQCVIVIVYCSTNVRLIHVCPIAHSYGNFMS